MWIRPGVVHRWTDVEDLDGPLILFEQGFLFAGPSARAAADGFAPTGWYLGESAWKLSVRAADHLAGEHAAAVADPRLASPPVLAHLLAALVLDAANFTTFFQRQEGLSPTRWRSARSGR